jgi:hypothetical protein
VSRVQATKLSHGRGGPVDRVSYAAAATAGRRARLELDRLSFVEEALMGPGRVVTAAAGGGVGSMKCADNLSAVMAINSSL